MANQKDGKNVSDGSTKHHSHASHNSQKEDRLLPPRGDYKTLLSFQKAEVIYDITFRFARKFLSKGCNPAMGLKARQQVPHGRLPIGK